MSKLVVLRLEGSNSYTVVDRERGTVEDIDIDELRELQLLTGEPKFSGVVEAFAIPDPIDISSRKFCAIV